MAYFFGHPERMDYGLQSIAFSYFTTENAVRDRRFDERLQTLCEKCKNSSRLPHAGWGLLIHI